MFWGKRGVGPQPSGHSCLYSGRAPGGARGTIEEARIGSGLGARQTPTLPTVTPASQDTVALESKRNGAGL